MTHANIGIFSNSRLKILNSACAYAKRDAKIVHVNNDAMTLNTLGYLRMQLSSVI